jgi:hypothetical protein
LIKRTLRNGELPLFYNTEKVKVWLFTPQEDYEIIPATQPKFFIPSYRVSPETVEQWIAKYSAFPFPTEDLALLRAESIFITTEDEGDFPRFGAALWFKPVERTP